MYKRFNNNKLKFDLKNLIYEFTVIHENSLSTLLVILN